MLLKIRNAEAKDLPEIFNVERNSYPPELQTTAEILEYRLETFGIRVGESEDKIVGFYTCVPVNLHLEDKEALLKQLLENRNPHYRKWFDLFNQGSQGLNALYVTSTGVHSDFQGRGLGKSLVQHSLELAKEYGLPLRASVLRLPGFKEYSERGVSAEEYVQRVKKGSLVDPMLNLYLKLGFALEDVIPDYEPDIVSVNFGVFSRKVIN